MARRRYSQLDGPDLVLSDGSLALTFVNTGSRRSPQLRNHADFVSWTARHGIMVDEDEARLAIERPDEAVAVFGVVEELHGLLTRICNDLADGQPPSPETIHRLNRVLGRFTPRRVLVMGQGSLKWHDQDVEPLYRSLWALGAASADLLTSADFGKVRRCARDDCDVLFLARGRGVHRKWCDTKACGLALRSKKHYLRVVKPARKAGLRP